MKPRHKIVNVNITTFKEAPTKILWNTMNEKRRNHRADPNDKFICSICLNSKIEEKSSENTKKHYKYCPICQKNCDICIEKATIQTDKSTEIQKQGANVVVRSGYKNTNTKSVQTVQTDSNKNINLLNEVLTVFQSRKINQEKSRNVIFKDASVSTMDIRYINVKLSISKTMQLSIDHTTNENGKFLVTSSKDKRSNIDLIINKSSSIPRMKVEELKYNLKEKTKSKDALEEVNRMFATVNRTYNNDSVNRPSVRSGPRVLPVVVENALAHAKPEESPKETRKTKMLRCKCCQTNMSSGDSIKCCQMNENKAQCCHKREIETHDKAQCCHTKESEKCDQCVYMMCCHYKNCRKTQVSAMVCENCRDANETSWTHPEHSFEDSG